MQTKWLESIPWENVITINAALCKAQKLEPTTKPKGLEAARRTWEKAASRSLSLKEVLDVCRECHEHAPFLFNNGNTFAAISRTLMAEWTKAMGPVEAQVLHTTVGHYIAGLIGRRELLQVLKHFEGNWKPQPSLAKAQEPSREEQPLPRVSTSPILAEAQPRA